MTSEELIILLRDARKTAGLSQRKLSALMGYSEAWVGRVETGRIGIQIDDISNWVQHCGLHLDLRIRQPSSESTTKVVFEVPEGLSGWDLDRIQRIIIGVSRYKTVEGRAERYGTTIGMLEAFYYAATDGDFYPLVPEE